MHDYYFNFFMQLPSKDQIEFVLTQIPRVSPFLKNVCILSCRLYTKNEKRGVKRPKNRGPDLIGVFLGKGRAVMGAKHGFLM
jgi:hypothetical protein